MAFGLDWCVCVNSGHPSASADNTGRRSGALHSSRHTAAVSFVHIHYVHTCMPLYICIQGELAD